MANPPERSSSSVHSRPSRSFRGRARTIPPQSPPGTTRPVASTQAARSPRSTAPPHAARITADPPTPGIQVVSRPRGRPPAGKIRSSASSPVGICGTVRSGNGIALGKRASMTRRRSAMADIWFCSPGQPISSPAIYRGLQSTRRFPEDQEEGVVRGVRRSYSRPSISRSKTAGSWR